MKVYLSGPMSGVEDFNYPAFAEAAASLREKGHEVISPAELDDPEEVSTLDPHTIEDHRWMEFVLRDLRVITTEGVETIACLPGWEGSRGAQMEVALGRQLGLPIVRHQDLHPLDVEQRVTNSRTGGQKGRKPQRMGLLPWLAVMEIAKVYGFGAEKYEEHNWRKGFDWSLSFDALQRHLALWWEGEECDEESDINHLAHAGFHILALIEFTIHSRYHEMDDRFASRE